MYPIGPSVKANLVVYFKVGAAESEIESFFDETVRQQHQEGRGYKHKDGVESILRLERVQDHIGIAITFFANPTEAQREEIRSAVRKSPVVYKVLENVVPSEVKSIE